MKHHDIRAGFRTLTMAALFAAVPALAGAQTTTWNIGWVNTGLSNYVDVIKSVPDRIAKATDGAVKIELFDTLVAGPEQPGAVRDGRLDGSFALNVWMSAEQPYLNVSLLPNLITSAQEFKDLLDPLLRDRFAVIWKEKYNSAALSYGVFESQVVISLKPVHKIEDFAGKRVRVSNTGQANLINSLGGAPTPIPFGEVVTALQRGVIDIVMTSVGPATGLGFDDVAKEMAVWNFTPVQPWTLIVNQQSWDALSPDLQQKVQAELRQIEDEDFARWQTFTDELFDRLTARGVNLYRVPAEEAAKAFTPEKTAPAFEQWHDLNAGAGTDGKALVEEIRAALGR